MRIIGGSARSRRLKTPSDNSIRPTSDKAREALYSHLHARYKLPQDAAVLDLFCGTGALGLEALSRGAKSAIFVDQDPKACALTQENIKALGFFSKARVLCSRAEDFLRASKGSRFDLVLLDPPYEKGLLGPALALLPGVLSEGAIVVAERSSREEAPQTPSSLVLQSSREYSAATFDIFLHQTRPEPAMTSPLTTRAKALKPSPTLAVSSRAKALSRQGIDIVDFSLGEPDFNTPLHIREAAKDALDQGITKYTEVPGTPKLREAIAARAQRELGLPYQPSEVVVGVGAKQLLFHSALSLLEPGDEAIIFSPYWVSYPDQVVLSGATPVIVETSLDEGFLPSAEKLEAALSERTKAVFLNSPANPTGATLDVMRLRALAQVLREYPRAHIISDEIYSAIHFGAGRAPSILHAAPDLRERTIIVDGASKTYAMTGWRLGWALGPQPIMSAIAAFQSQSTSNATAFAQAGLLAALEGDQACVESMRQEFLARRDLIASLLREIPRVRFALPDGAFYILLDVRPYLSSPKLVDFGEGSLGLSSYLLEHAKIAVVPGSAFGAEGFIRFSYTLSRERLSQGIARLREGLAALAE